MRLSGRMFVVLTAIVGLVIVAATDQIVPASSAHQAQIRIWLAARASGIATYLLLTAQVLVGLVLSNPTNQTAWRLSRPLFPWHEDLLVFVLAFVTVHVVSIVADPYAGVGLVGAFIPGLSAYRTAPVALGSLALYAMLLTGLTARYARRLPSGAWPRLHRLSLVVFGIAWVHGLLSGTDGLDLEALYLATGFAVVGAAAYRYWILDHGRRGATADAASTFLGLAVGHAQAVAAAGDAPGVSPPRGAIDVAPVPGHAGPADGSEEVA